MRVPPETAVVRQQAEELKRAVEKRFPNVEIEYLDWEQILERRRQGLPVRDAYDLDLDVDAYLWIRGEAGQVEKAAGLAVDLESDIEERSRVAIEVRTGGAMWCRRSGREPEESWDPDVRGRFLYVGEDPRGVIFLCWEIEPHVHEWGRVKPQPPMVEPR